MGYLFFKALYLCEERAGAILYCQPLTYALRVPQSLSDLTFFLGHLTPIFHNVTLLFGVLATALEAFAFPLRFHTPFLGNFPLIIGLRLCLFCVHISFLSFTTTASPH